MGSLTSGGQCMCPLNDFMLLKEKPYTTASWPERNAPVKSSCQNLRPESDHASSGILCNDKVLFICAVHVRLSN